MGLQYVREGMRAFAQDMTLPYICSNFFYRLPLLYFLAYRSGMRTKSDTVIGRPGMQPILSGVPVSKARQIQLSGFSTMVPIDKGFVDDGKHMGSSDTRPSATTPDNEQYGTAEFRRTRLVHPMKISHMARKLAMGNGSNSASNADLAVKNLTGNAVSKTLAVHATALANMFWFGGSINPTNSVDYTFNQNSMPWTYSLGILSALSNSNVYGRVNRGVLGATAAWNGRQVTTALAPDVCEIIDEANIGSSSADAGADTGVGDGACTLLLCTKKQFRKFKRQARSTGIKYWPEGIPEMGELGYKREVMQVDNTYVTYDPLCPAGYAAALNLGTWVYAGDSQDNFRVTDWESLCDNGQIGGEEADQAFVITEESLICWAPYANVLFTNIQE